MLGFEDFVMSAYTLILIGIVGWRYDSETRISGMLRVAWAFALSMLSVFGVKCTLDAGAADSVSTMLTDISNPYLSLGFGALVLYVAMTFLFRPERDRS